MRALLWTGSSVGGRLLSRGCGCTVFQSFANHHHCVAPWFCWDPPKEGARRRLCFLRSHVLKLGSDSLFQKLQLTHGYFFPSQTPASTSWYPLLRGWDPSPVGAPCLWSIILEPPHRSPHQLRHGLVGLLLQEACCKCGKGEHKEGIKKKKKAQWKSDEGDPVSHSQIHAG